MLLCICGFPPSSRKDALKDSRKQLTKRPHCERGKGRYNSVFYCFTLTKQSCFAGYECRAHRNVLDVRYTQRMCTKWFEVCDKKWRMRLEQTDDGYLSAYLDAGNFYVPITVHYSFTVVNHKNEKQNVTKGRTCTFKPGDSWGLSKLALLSSLTDPHGGYLAGEQFTVKLDMRLKSRLYEWHSVTAVGSSAILTWKIRDLTAGSPMELCSDDFSIGCTKWRLRFLPKGSGLESSKSAIYIENLEKFYVKANCKLTAINHVDISKTISEGEDHQFAPLQPWGYEEFIDVQALQNSALGFLLDGWIVIKAEINVLDVAHSCPQPTSATTISKASTPEIVHCPEAGQASKSKKRMY